MIAMTASLKHVLMASIDGTRPGDHPSRSKAKPV